MGKKKLSQLKNFIKNGKLLPKEIIDINNDDLYCCLCCGRLMNKDHLNAESICYDCINEDID